MQRVLLSASNMYPDFTRVSFPPLLSLEFKSPPHIGTARTAERPRRDAKIGDISYQITSSWQINMWYQITVVFPSQSSALSQGFTTSHSNLEMGREQVPRKPPQNLLTDKCTLTSMPIKRMLYKHKIAYKRGGNAR